MLCHNFLPASHKANPRGNVSRTYSPVKNHGLVMYAGGREWTMTGIPTVKNGSKLFSTKKGPTSTQIRIFTRRQSSSSWLPTIALWGRANGRVAIPKAIRDVKIMTSSIPTMKTWSPDSSFQTDSIQFLEWETLLLL